MTAKKKTNLHPDDEYRAEQEEKKETEFDEAIMEQSAEAAGVPEDTGSYVYCGPSVRGVARQYTVFRNGLTDTVKEFCAKHPIAKALIVPADQFAEMRIKLETKGTAETLIYNKLKSEL